MSQSLHYIRHSIRDGWGRVFTRFYDPKIISGWGNRAYNWELGVSVQQELMTPVSSSRS